MKKTFKFASLIAALAFVGLASAQVATNSTSGATAYSGTGGGLSASIAYNNQTASAVGISDSNQQGGQHGSHTGSAYVAGGVQTTSTSLALNYSTGTGTGAAGANGTSTASVDGSKSFSMAGPTGISGSATGNAESISSTAAGTGTNGGAYVKVGAVGGYVATASAAQGGVFNDTASATTSAAALAGTTPTTQFTWGSGVTDVVNEAAANASATSKSGAVISNTP